MFTKTRNLNKKFFCEKCMFSTDYKSHYEKYLKTKKHKNPAFFGAKIKHNYNCELCDYNTCKKSDIQRHETSRKHKMRKKMHQEMRQKTQDLSEEKTEKTEKTEKKHNNEYLCKCGKKYKYRQSLHVHTKKCTFETTKQMEKQLEKQLEEKIEKKIKKDMEEKMSIELDKRLNQQMELYTEIIKNEVIPNISNAIITNNTTNNNITNNTTNTTNNTNNNFNLNIFLNETCKDAINMTEFIENIKIGLQELEFVRENGIVKGISNVFVNELNTMDVDKRPIHCTDVKRKTLYIKEDNKWDKENKVTNQKIDKSIQHINKKHVDSIKEWEEKNPNWSENEQLTMEYLRIARNSTTPIEKSGAKRIISDIASEVDITDIKNKGIE